MISDQAFNHAMEALFRGECLICGAEGISPARMICTKAACTLQFQAIPPHICADLVAVASRLQWAHSALAWECPWCDGEEAGVFACGAEHQKLTNSQMTISTMTDLNEIREYEWPNGDRHVPENDPRLAWLRWAMAADL